MPDALVISEPVSVPAEINAANWLADYTTTTDPQTEDIELYTDGCINIKSAYQSLGGCSDINLWGGDRFCSVKNLGENAGKADE